jgi:hypothetical protein
MLNGFIFRVFFRILFWVEELERIFFVEIFLGLLLVVGIFYWLFWFVTLEILVKLPSSQWP